MHKYFNKLFYLYTKLCQAVFQSLLRIFRAHVRTIFMDDLPVTIKE